jgi:hypothetical protein
MPKYNFDSTNIKSNADLQALLAELNSYAIVLVAFEQDGPGGGNASITLQGETVDVLRWAQEHYDDITADEMESNHNVS